MTIVFVGGEMPSFVPSTTNDKEVASQHDATWARCSTLAVAAEVTPPNGYSSELFTPVSPAWVHLDISIQQGSGDNALWNDRIILYDSSNVERVKLQFKEVGGVYRLLYDVGAGFVQAGADYAVGGITRQVFDIGITTNSASGRIRLYNSGTLQIDSGTINLTAMDDIAKIKVAGGNTRVNPGYSITNTYASQIVVANVPTIGYKVATYVPTGTGANTAWTGTYVDVDEVIYEDGDFIATGVADDIETFTLTGPALGGAEIRAVVVTARAKRGETGPQNLQLAVRSGGVNYFSPTHALDLGFTPEIGIWETDPATGVGWLAAAITTLEAGTKAIT